jgi:hypothetical protein
MFRSLLAALLVLALIPAVAVANTSAWASRSVMDRATFTETLDRALDAPEAREYLAKQLAAAMFDALIEADERSRLILAPLAGQSTNAPAAAIVRGLEPRIEAALDHPRIAAARLRLVEAAHDTLIGLDDAESTVRIEDDTLVVNGADLLRAALDAVEPRFGQLGVSIPEGAAVDIELASSPGLAATGVVLPTIDRLATILPLVAIATALLVIVLAHRRARALAVVGLAIAAAGAACLGLVWFGGEMAVAAESPVSPTLVRSTYDALSANLVTQSLVLVAAGVGLVLLASVVRALTPSRRSVR